jgi:20S proteasome subunit alpha 2
MGDMNFSLTTFNKTGKLLQIEYALARVAQGKMALGIRGKTVLILSFSLVSLTELINMCLDMCIL